MKPLIRSSDHLKEALKVRVDCDEKGNPVLVSEKKTKKLTLLGVKMKGDKEWRLKQV